MGDFETRMKDFARTEAIELGTDSLFKYMCVKYMTQASCFYVVKCRTKHDLNEPWILNSPRELLLGIIDLNKPLDAQIEKLTPTKKKSLEECF